MKEFFDIDDNLLELAATCEKELLPEFEKIDSICLENSLKVLNAFQENRLCEAHFNGTSGYGYGDIGREAIENIFSFVLDAEDSLVRSQFISGSHALTVALFAFFMTWCCSSRLLLLRRSVWLECVADGPGMCDL